MSKAMYMHTIGGYPAFYEKGRQICYILRYCSPQKVLVHSFKQIKKEQEASILWRVKQGYDKITDKKDYGWIKILI